MLIPLEEYDYSMAAVEYGVHLTSGLACEITGLSILDLPSIEKSIGPVPAGANYYARKQEEQRKQQEQLLAEKIIAEFEQICGSKKIPHRVIQREGDPEEIIIDESKYHDLLITGWRTSFRYGEEPDKHLQHEVISHGICPVLIIPKYYRPIHKILLCYDGNNQSTKAIHQFFQFNIYSDKQFTLLTVNNDREEGEQLLNKMTEYLKFSKVAFQSVCLSGHPQEAILTYVNDHDIDLIVLGAYGQKGISKFFFGSTTQKLVKNANRPLFIYH
jgi:nucleotide-binding universal stress UspA family protein